MPIETLTELQYSEDRKGPFRLYIYHPNSEYHGGGVCFRDKPKYPDEEITTEQAFTSAKEAQMMDQEIRICDGGDMLVFHARNRRVIYGEHFWEDVFPHKRNG